MSSTKQSQVLPHIEARREAWPEKLEPMKKSKVCDTIPKKAMHGASKAPSLHKLEGLTGKAQCKRITQIKKDARREAWPDQHPSLTSAQVSSGRPVRPDTGDPRGRTRPDTADPRVKSRQSDRKSMLQPIFINGYPGLSENH